MRGKTPKRLALPVLLLSLAGAAAALTVSVAPSEGLAYAPPPDGSGSPLGFLTSGCLSQLFDAGFVVTDAAPTRLPRSAWDASGASDPVLPEARAGLVDYVIALYAEWKPSAFHKDVLLPARIEYRLLRVSDGSVLAEGEVEGAVDSEDASAHFESTVSQAGVQAARPCVKLLATLAQGGE
jgi:hypothetical protein